MGTVFQHFSHETRAFINPEDLTKPNPDLPNVCVSTYSENIINQQDMDHRCHLPGNRRADPGAEGAGLHRR